jgi:nucleoside-diphosphate-sugar epimerase
MNTEKFFVTGALGCLGAWVVRNLVQDNTPVTVYDLGNNQSRLQLIMSDEELSRVQFITGDITDTAALETAMRQAETTHIIHLAALQVPFCRANPPLGARVNVVGTVNIFEAAKNLGLKHVVFASSVAVYGKAEEYTDRIIPNDAMQRPRNLYGVYKQANEGTAFIYHQDYGINSIGLRPYTIYGPGRDQGMTSTPTKGMLAAAFIQCARTEYYGAGVFNLGGSVSHMKEVVGAIDAAVPGMAGQITFAEQPLALPDGTEDSELVKAVGTVPNTPLTQGVAATIQNFKQALAENKVSLDQLNG